MKKLHWQINEYLALLEVNYIKIASFILGVVHANPRFPQLSDFEIKSYARECLHTAKRRKNIRVHIGHTQSEVGEQYTFTIYLQGSSTTDKIINSEIND